MKRQAGFTLTELMTTMSIVALLVGIGVPSYRYVTTANRMSSEINGLLGDLQFARSEAIKEGLKVVVCPSTDGATCSGATDFKTGWIIWPDANGNGSIDTGEGILRVQQALTSADTIDSNAATQITFNREGFADGLAAGTVITLHDSTHKLVYTRCLQITVVGKMTTVTNATDGTCT